MRTEVVTYIPDSNWIKRDRSRFTGKVIVEDWDGNLIKLYNYRSNGTIDSAYAATAAKNGTKTKSYAAIDCVEYGYWQCNNSTISSDKSASVMVTTKKRICTSWTSITTIKCFEVGVDGSYDYGTGANSPDYPPGDIDCGMTVQSKGTGTLNAPADPDACPDYSPEPLPTAGSLLQNRINFLTTILNLDSGTEQWLYGQENVIREKIIKDAEDFLASHTPDFYPQMKNHIINMASDSSYLNFTTNYNLLGYSQMWWENEAWLSDMSNFEKVLTNGYINTLGLSDFINSANYFEPEDNNAEWAGSKAYIPNPIILSNGDAVAIEFGIWTKDGLSSNQQVSTRLIEALTAALNLANGNIRITSIRIYCTTNGVHQSTSNHARATAVDISKINGQFVLDLGNGTLVNELQNAFDTVPNRRENFGPAFKHKLGQPWTVGGHKDHIHFSINGN